MFRFFGNCLPEVLIATPEKIDDGKGKDLPASVQDIKHELKLNTVQSQNVLNKKYLCVDDHS